MDLVEIAKNLQLPGGRQAGMYLHGTPLLQGPRSRGRVSRSVRRGLRPSRDGFWGPGVYTTAPVGRVPKSQRTRDTMEAVQAYGTDSGELLRMEDRYRRSKGLKRNYMYSADEQASEGMRIRRKKQGLLVGLKARPGKSPVESGVNYPGTPRANREKRRTLGIKQADRVFKPGDTRVAHVQNVHSDTLWRIYNGNPDYAASVRARTGTDRPPLTERLKVFKERKAA